MEARGRYDVSSLTRLLQCLQKITTETHLEKSVCWCACCPGRVKKLQWNWEFFFFWHIELNSRFIVMTLNEVTMERPGVGTGFSVNFCFLSVKTLPIRLEVLH